LITQSAHTLPSSPFWLGRCHLEVRSYHEVV